MKYTLLAIANLLVILGSTALQAGQQIEQMVTPEQQQIVKTEKERVFQAMYGLKKVIYECPAIVFPGRTLADKVNNKFVDSAFIFTTKKLNKPGDSAQNYKDIRSWMWNAVTKNSLEYGTVDFEEIPNNVDVGRKGYAISRPTKTTTVSLYPGELDEPLFGTHFHENFHSVYQYVGSFDRGARNTLGKRKKFIEALVEIYKNPNDESLIQKAALIQDQLYKDNPQLEKFKTADIREGSAAYFEYIADAVVDLGCDKAKDDKNIYEYFVKKIDEIQDEYSSTEHQEHYIIGLLAGLILRKRNPEWASQIMTQDRMISESRTFPEILFAGHAVGTSENLSSGRIQPGSK